MDVTQKTVPRGVTSVRHLQGQRCSFMSPWEQCSAQYALLVPIPELSGSAEAWTIERLIVVWLYKAQSYKSSRAVTLMVKTSQFLITGQTFVEDIR